METTAYQSTLKWYIEKAMRDKRCPYLAIEALDERRSKVKRIRQFYTDACDNGELYYHESMEEFVEQFKDYPEVKHEDLLEAPVHGFKVLENFEYTDVDGEYQDAFNDEQVDDLPDWRCAP